MLWKPFFLCSQIPTESVKVILCDTPRYIYVIELKLTKNGGLVAAEKQIMNNQYLEPFKADKKRKVVGLAIELDDMGKGLLEWKKVE